MPNGWVTVPLPQGGSLRFAPAGSGCGSSGCRLWTSSVVLCGALHAVRSRLSGLRAVELGAGAGAPGLLAARLGCSKVLVSDAGEEPLQVLRGNVKRFQASLSGKEGEGCRLDAAALDFTELRHVAACAGAERFDLVLASDCAYEPGKAAQLMAAVSNLLALGGFALVADRNRPLSGPAVRAQFRAEAERYGLAVEELDPGQSFQEGLAAMGLINGAEGLITGCVDGRSFLLRITWQGDDRAASAVAGDIQTKDAALSAPPLPLSLDEMD